MSTIKTYNEIQPGDIFRCEYGDYGNYVNIVFESQEISEDGKWLRTVGHYKNGNLFEGSSMIINGNVPDYEIIGHEKAEKLKELIK